MASIKRPIIGVNLGGWLVLEPWMTPTLFASTGAVDEYTFCRDADAARLERLKQFRDTFITRDDFAWLAAQGMQAVRLPVGYWLFGKQGSFLKTCQYVDMVFDWADEFGLQVLLGLHAAPGSQNGEMHSGQKGAVGWLEQSNIDATVAVLERIAKRYGRKPALLGFSLLNEPSASLPVSVLEAFYERARSSMEPHCTSGIWFVMSDGFRPRRWRAKLPSFVMDHHQYQIFAPLDKHLSAGWQLLRTRWQLPFKLRGYARAHPLIIGEWSLVLANAGSDADARSYGRLQLKAFQRAEAHFYWSYKTEKPGLWNFRDCVSKGLITMTAKPETVEKEV